MKLIYTILFIFISCNLLSQDTYTNQYLFNPVIINPAHAGSSKNSWRFNTILRQKQFSENVKFNNAITSLDGKFNNSGFGAGLSFINDESINGAVKKNNIFATLSYTIASFSDFNTNKLSLGFSGIYANQNINFSNLTFANQFIYGGGFNTNLFSGESLNNNSSKYYSTAEGILFTHLEKYISYELGISGYFLNKPILSVMNDSLNFISQKYNFHGNFSFLNKFDGLLSLNFLYQQEKNNNNVVISLLYNSNYFQNENNYSLNGGFIINNKRTLSPLIGIDIKNLKFSITYDIPLINSNVQYLNFKTFEISLGIHSKN